MWADHRRRSVTEMWWVGKPKEEDVKRKAFLKTKRFDQREDKKGCVHKNNKKKNYTTAQIFTFYTNAFANMVTTESNDCL